MIVIIMIILAIIIEARLAYSLKNKMGIIKRKLQVCSLLLFVAIDTELHRNLFAGY